MTVTTKPDILTPGAHTTATGYEEVSTYHFTTQLLMQLPGHLVYRRAGVPGEIRDGKFEHLEPDRMRLLVDQFARLYRSHEKDGAVRTSYQPCSRDHATLFLARATNMVRPLDYITPYPMLRWSRPTEGPLVEHTPVIELTPAGYSNGIFYNQPSELRHLTPIRDPKLIRDTLLDLVVDFPFQSDFDRDTYIGLLLTPLIRPLIVGNIPLHLITSTVQGSGKTKLASEILGGIYLGDDVEVLQLTGSEESMDKLILARLLSGAQLVHLDNLQDFLDSSALASLLTCKHYSGRLLGVSRTVTAPNSLILVATGNNTRMSSELTRRTIPIRLQSPLERPENRTDFIHPRIAEFTRANRSALLACLIGAVLNWSEAGEPLSTVPLGSFEDWVGLVGGVLQNAGFVGFLGHLDEWRQASDEFSDHLQMLVEAWAVGMLERSPSSLFEIAREKDLFPWVWQKGTDKSQLTSFSTRILKKATGRVVRGYRVCHRQSGNNRSYYLEELGAG